MPRDAHRPNSASACYLQTLHRRDTGWSPSIPTKGRARLKDFARKALSRRVRPHRILFGRLRGRMIVTSWHDYPGALLGSTERPLLEWFYMNVHLGETWIDVGAHYGY